MISSKNIRLLLFIALAPLLFITCDDGPVQSDETKNQVELDSELIGTWKGLGSLPRTLTFSQTSKIEGSGVEITQDSNNYCENIGADYLNRVDFKWEQTKKADDGWSSFYYDELKNLDCGGARKLSRLAFERYYKIDGDTLYLGTEDYSMYVRVE